MQGWFTRNGVNRTIETPALEGKGIHETLYMAIAHSAHHWKLLASPSWQSSSGIASSLCFSSARKVRASRYR